MGLTVSIPVFLSFLIVIFSAIICNDVFVWIFATVYLIIFLLTHLILIPSVTIDEQGITVYKSSKKQTRYSWNEIKCYYNESHNRISVIAIVLKNDCKIYLDNRKKIRQEIQKFCGEIPDLSDINKVETGGERYSNYINKLIDLSECEFESTTSNYECCVFCNSRTYKIDEYCYCTKKNSRNYHVCPSCFKDFQKYCRFKIK